MFYTAKPIYPAGHSKDMHSFCCFRATAASLKGTELHIAAATFYQLYVNGKFIARGPARTAKGYAREDVISLDGIGEEKNEILIAVAGYYIFGGATVRQEAFLLAELRAGDDVLLATGCDFQAYMPKCKCLKVERYSSQRHFNEVWDFRHGHFLEDISNPVVCEVLNNEFTILDRLAPYPYYEDITVTGICSRGTLAFDETLPYHTEFYSDPSAPSRFAREEIMHFPYEWVQRHVQSKTGGAEELPLTIGELEYAILDFGRIETGFILLSALANEEADVIVAFSEYSATDRFEFTNIHAHNVLEYLLPTGKPMELVSFEPYVMKTAIIAVKRGSITLSRFGIKNFAHDIRGVKYPDFKDETLNAVYRGAVRTFAHNALDIYMDCPSRERAGWLCDSYFTGQTEYVLFGETKVEDAFLQNYRLYKNRGEYPQGALPMRYPSEHHTSRFIPQWTMWYILEVEQYINQRGHRAEAELFRPSIEGLLTLYAKYENADGLLERLPSFNFVEWSRANDWTMDVNYPTNFLYAAVLEAVYRLYGDDTMHQRSRAVIAETTKQSFNGKVFLDHAVRDEKTGELVACPGDCSEAGQYYAILFGDVDLENEQYAYLKDLVYNVFGADRTDHPEIHPINAFIGAYLRLEVLLKLKQYPLVLRDVAAFFGCMEATTGTLWEYRQEKGSKDHGFASFACVALSKAYQALQTVTALEEKTRF